MFERIFELICVICALFVGLNVVVRWTNSLWSFDDSYATMPFDIACVGAAVTLISTIPTPFARSEEIDRSIIGVASVILAGSRIIAHPSILSESIIDVLSKTLNVTSLVERLGVTDETVIDPESLLQTSGANIIMFLVYAKLTLYVCGSYLVVLGIFTRHKADSNPLRLLLSLIPVAGAIVLYCNMNSSFTGEINGKGPSAVQAVLIGGDYERLIMFDEICLVTVMVFTFFFSFVRRELVVPASTYLFANISLQYHYRNDDSYWYATSFVCSVIFICITAQIYVFNIIYYVHIHDLVFRIGVGLSVLSVAYLFFAVNLPWFEVDFTFTIIPEGLREWITEIYGIVQKVVGFLYEVSRLMNPCVHTRLAYDTNVNLTSLTDDNRHAFNAAESVRSTENLESTSLKNRFQLYSSMKETQSCFKNACTENSCYFKDDPNLQPLICNQTRQREVEASNAYKHTKTSGVLDKPDKAYTFQDEPEVDETSVPEETFIDQTCEDIKCAVISGLTLAAIAASFIPFGGGTASYALKTAGSVMHGVFRVGKKFIKFIPMLRKIRKRTRRLFTMIMSFANPARARSSWSTRLMVLVLASIVSFTVTIVFMLHRRRGQVSIEKVFALTMSIFIPVIAMNFACLFLIQFIPILIEDVMNILPGLLQADVILKSGYYSLRLAHVLSTAAPALIMLSEVLYLFRAELVAFWYLCCSRSSRFGYMRIDGSVARISRWKYLKGLMRLQKDKFIAWQGQLFDNLEVFDNRYAAAIFFCILTVLVILESCLRPDIRKYIVIDYGGDTTLASYSTYFAEFRSQSNLHDTIFHSLRDEFCSIDGAAVQAVAGVAIGSMTLLLSAFATLFLNIITAVAPITDLVEKVLGLGSVIAELKRLSVWIGKVVAFGIPGGTIGLIFIIICRAVESGELPTSGIVSTLWISVSNIIIQLVLGTVLHTVTVLKIPLISVRSELGYDHYASIFCSVLTIMAAFAIYIGAKASDADEIQ